MIQIKSLYKSFEDRTVLNDINFTFENGKTNLIIGQSGSGKTVLMKCLVGLLTPENGEVLYDGRNLITMGKRKESFTSGDGYDLPKCSIIRLSVCIRKRHVSAGYVF